jgi:hypothetical protein
VYIAKAVSEEVYALTYSIPSGESFESFSLSCKASTYLASSCAAISLNESILVFSADSLL